MQPSLWIVASPNTSTKAVHSPRSLSPLHFDIRNIQQICLEKLCPSAQRLFSATLLERWPQVCRVKITCTKLPTNRFVSAEQISMKYVANWIPLRIRVRARKTQPHLKGNINEAPTCAVLVHAPVTNCFAEKRSGVQPSENYMCMHMTLNIKRHINFLIRHIIYWKSLSVI